MTVRIAFDNSYVRLEEPFFARVLPTAATEPRLIELNRPLAIELDLDPDDLATERGVEVLAGKRIADGADPIATAYAGHQFGGFVPQLGDGRAVLLGEVIGRDGGRRDIQIKGSGPTPFSRRGDGKAALGPVLREYVVSEAMAALGIPTTRSLAALLTGQSVVRDTLLPGAMLVRVASSHIRVGTFQFFAARGDQASVRRLADYAIARHYPEAAQAEQPYRAFLQSVVARQASLVAQWMGVGFIHGVMNTDNCSIAGETIDYGPCAFMDAYDPKTVFSSIDDFGRYAYVNQPSIVQWNLARLVECLLPLLSDSQEEGIALANAILASFPPAFQAAYLSRFRRKLGLLTEREDDLTLISDLLDRMTANAADFTLTFRGLCGIDRPMEGRRAPRDLFIDPTAFDDWAARWQVRLEMESHGEAERRALMRAANPAFIPRNHQVEAMIRAAVEDGDFGPFRTVLRVLATPFEDQPEFAPYGEPPPAEQRVYRTFCGT